MKNKKGITLAETIVAMAVLIVISLAIFSVSNYALMQTKKGEINNFFTVESQNYINCYLLGEEEYADAVMFYSNVTTNYNESCSIYYSNEFALDISSDSLYRIDLSFESNKFLVECYNNIENKLIYSVEV